MSHADRAFLPAPPALSERRLVFSHSVSEVGLFSLSPLHSDDFPMLHQWLTEPRARFWGMQHLSLEQVSAVYRGQIDCAHQAPLLGFFGQRPAFLLETYDPAHDELGQHYPVQAGDRGMHFLVAPAVGPAIHGFSRAVLHTILAFLFATPGVRRVVVEPDVLNERIHPLNRACGFQYQRQVQLSSKTAWLAFCTAEAFVHATHRPLETTP